MLWIKACHIIAMVAWFSGIFYLPRLYVYHAMSDDTISQQRFMIMEKKLYFSIMWPAAILTVALGIALVLANPTYYGHAGWFHAKLSLVFLLILYHLYLGYVRRQFSEGKNTRSHRYYRVINELPVLLLAGITILVIVKPF